jgi:hypothetical protein
MVNGLLTITIKVNIPVSDRSGLDRGRSMKKQTRGFWNWILGSGWCGGGSNG